ncbi:hypothetical protein EKH57_07195 [Halorubrum sp. BOL3-1]|nr:hypothetical protein [Halorubrum sp. BOL3-1]QAU12525.1 hypothetical protein EKH57_07195 [Halorubrum sp. BOL3-1]
MSTLWQVGYVIAVVLGLSYAILPKRIHAFGFAFLRRSPSDQSEGSDTPVRLYRGLGVLFLFIGATGLFNL